MNADIKVFPAKEMSALDMAEILDAALIGDGILQGCEITLTNGQLNIASGRMHIKGRLAEVSAGTIELPSGTNTALSCRLLAVCNLSLADPFYISLFDDAEYASIQSITSSDATFNVSNGVKYVILGTAVVDCVNGRVTSWTPHKTGSKPRINKNYTDDLGERIDNLSMTVTSNKTATDNAIAKIVQYDDSKLTYENKYRYGEKVPAKSSATISGKIVYGYQEKQTSETSWAVASDGEGSVPAAIRRHVPKGIVGINVSNAAFKVGGKAIGKNANNVVLQRYNFGTENWNITVLNTGSAEAIIDIGPKVLYAINPTGFTVEE